MNSERGIARAAAACVLVATWLLSGCGMADTPASAADAQVRGQGAHMARALVSGTRMRVALRDELSTALVDLGDRWRGSLVDDLVTLNGSVIAAGTSVEGVVAAAFSASRSEPAMIELGVSSIQIDGQDECIAANAEPVTGGPGFVPEVVMLAEHLDGGIGSNDPAVPGGYGATRSAGAHAKSGLETPAASRALVLPAGTIMSFRVSQTVALRRE